MARTRRSTTGVARFALGLAFALVVGTSGALGRASPSHAAGITPAPPTGVTATVVGPRSVRVNWTAPSMPAGSAPITGYAISYLNRGDVFDVVEVGPSSTSVVVGDLLRSTIPFDFSVNAVRAVQGETTQVSEPAFSNAGESWD
jgi:Fibronectin type III domain